MAKSVEAEELSIVTGRYHPLLTRFSTVFVSEYDDNAADVQKIKSALARKRKQKDIAVEYGVTPQAISAIHTNRSWAWVM